MYEQAIGYEALILIVVFALFLMGIATIASFLLLAYHLHRNGSGRLKPSRLPTIQGLSWFYKAKIFFATRVPQLKRKVTVSVKRRLSSGLIQL